MDIFQKRHFLRRHKPSLSAQLKFLRTLYRLLHDGYPLLRALETLGWNENFSRMVTIVRKSLLEGHHLDYALEQAGFHYTITDYLYFANGNGMLQDNLQKCIVLLEHREKYMRKIRQVTRYPIILGMIFLLLIYFIQQTVLPAFEEMFRVNGSASQVIQFTMLFLDVFQTAIFMTGLAGLVTIFFWKRYRKRIPLVKLISLYEKIPLLRAYLKLQTSLQFSTHFSSLIHAGLSIRDILHHLSEQQKLPIMSYYSRQMYKELQHGVPLHSLLAASTLLDRSLSTIFQQNQDMKTLGKDLSIYADLLLERIQENIMKMITYIQPVFFSVIALFILFIYFTLMWPMFDLINSI